MKCSSEMASVFYKCTFAAVQSSSYQDSVLLDFDCPAYARYKRERVTELGVVIKPGMSKELLYAIGTSGAL